MDPKSRHFFGMASVGERGQIVIPQDAREYFGIKKGDKLIVMGKMGRQGLILMKSDAMRSFAEHILEHLSGGERQKKARR
jgi:AbrB family looped-hinge helix DNA binding protein